MSDLTPISHDSQVITSEYIELDNSADTYRYYHVMKMHTHLIKAKRSLDREYTLDPANYKFITRLKPEEIIAEHIRCRRDSLVEQINHFIYGVLHMSITDTEKLKLIELGNIMIANDPDMSASDLMCIVIRYITQLIPKTRSIANELISICDQLAAAFRELITNYTSDIVSLGNSIVAQIVSTFKNRILQHESTIDEYLNVMNLFTEATDVAYSDPIYRILEGIIRIDDFMIRISIHRILFTLSSGPRLYIKRELFDPAKSKLELIDQYVNTPENILDEVLYKHILERERMRAVNGDSDDTTADDSQQ